MEQLSSHPRIVSLAETAFSAETTPCTSTAAAKTSASASRSVLFRTSLVDHELAALEFFVVEHLDGLSGLFVCCHFNECETFGSSRHAIRDNLAGLNSPSLGKICGECLIRG